MLTYPKKVEIHKFEKEGKTFLLDVRRSISMEIEAIWDDILDVMDGIDGRPSQAILDQLSGKYPEDLLIEAMEQLEQDKLLMSEDNLPAPGAIKIPDEPKLPINVMDFNVSHDCTMWCKYCYGGGGTYSGPKQLMSQEVARKAVDFFVAHSGKHKECEIIFFGGEPLMNMPVIRDVVGYSRKQFAEQGKKIRFGMTTNVTLLSKEIIAFLNRNKIRVTVSLDGDKETHDRMRVFRDGRGTYDSILPKIKAFIGSRKGRVPVRATITHHNLEEVDLARHFFEVGFDNVIMSPVAALPSEEYALTDEDIEVLKGKYTDLAHYFLEMIRGKDKRSIMTFTSLLPKIYRRTGRVYGCGGGRNYMMVDPIGDLYVCHRCGGMDKLKLGDIYTGIDPERQRRILQNHVDLREDCATCWARYLCGGGCIANNVVYYDTLSKSDQRACDLYRHQIELTMWLYSEVYEKEKAFIERVCKRDEKPYMREPEEEEQKIEIKENDE